MLHSQPDLGNLENLDGNSETIEAIFDEMDSTEAHARRNAGLVHSKTFADKLAGLFNPPPEVCAVLGRAELETICPMLQFSSSGHSSEDHHERAGMQAATLALEHCNVLK